MKKTNIFVVGVGGRMGLEIASLLRVSSELEFAGGSDKAEDSQQKTVSSISKANPQSIDVVIDFSTRENLLNTTKWCIENKKPLVAGVTGLTDGEKQNLKSAGKMIPVLWSANMSVGVAVMRKMLSAFQDLESFDFAMTEFHHNKKIDNPSGTALVLYEDLLKAVKKEVPPPVGIRGGGIFGVHTVYAMSDEEVVTIEHQALNRTVFARGALRAAHWLANKGPGFYSMMDVLG